MAPTCYQIMLLSFQVLCYISSLVSKKEKENIVLKVAVIGIGEQCWDNILPSLAQIPTISLIATCDIDKNKADLAAMKYGAKAYYNYKSMIEHEELDAIIVACDPYVHYDVAKLALEKDIAIFVEKPPTITRKELETLIAINKNKVITGVGLNFNYAEAVRMVDRLAKEKDIGRIKHISVSHYGVKPKKPLWGHKSLVKSFLLSQTMHAAGFITKYGAIIKSHDVKASNKNGKIFASGLFHLQNASGDQIIANITTGNLCPHFMWRAELITDKSIVIRINSLWELEIFDSNKTTNLIDTTKRWKDVWNPSPLSTGYSRTGYFTQFDEFFNCVINKKQFSSSFEKLVPAYKVLDILEEELECANTVSTNSP